MRSQPYLSLVQYKQWADDGLFKILSENIKNLNADDQSILLRILDHIQAVDHIFQHHLMKQAHEFQAPRSAKIPDLGLLASRARTVDAWYVSYVEALPEHDVDETIGFTFTNGAPFKMRRGDMLLHVCLHGTYHRGNAGIILQKNGIAPNDDRMTDFLQMTE